MAPNIVTLDMLRDRVTSPNIMVTTGFDTTRARSYILRLPLFTKATMVCMAALAVLSLIPFWDLQRWGSLAPSKVSLFNAYRINTYPFVHLGLVHALFNIVALTPLLERFELEYGTLTTLALFIGPLSSIPAVIYIAIQKFLGQDIAIMGASIWVFLLLSWESIRVFQSNPHLNICSTQIPTWTLPLVLIAITEVLMPSSSIFGHVCGAVVGYLLGLGHLRFLNPPVWALRWVENRLNLLARLPHYVSVDQTTYGRFGILPTTNQGPRPASPLFGA